MNTFKALVFAFLCFIPLALAGQSLPLAVELDARSVVLDKPANVLERHRLAIQPQLLREERVAASLLHQHRYHLEAGEIESRGRDSFTWRGRIVDDSGEAGSATLSVRGNRVRGQVVLNRHNYQISTDSAGNYWMDRLDPAQMPPAHPPGGPLIPEGEDATPLALQDLPVADEGDEPPVVDVIVFYTDAAISHYANEADMRFAIRSAVDANNTALINSEVPGRVRLVGTFPIDYEETGEGSDALAYIRDDDHADAVRERYSSDMVAIVSNDQDICGVAYLLTQYPQFEWQRTVYSMTSALTQCLGGQTFAHELGHNMGLHHNPENTGDATPEDLIEIFAYGHFVDLEFRTIMSYPNQCSQVWPGCPRIDHFSDPDITAPASTLASGTADRNNAEVLRRTMPVAQNWRQQPSTLADASGLPELDFETGGDGVWVAQNEFVHGDGTALLSAPVMADEIAWLEAAVMATESFDLGFYARATVADSSGVLNVYADDSLLTGFDELTDEWALQTVSVPAGTDSLRWEWTSNGASAAETGAVAMAGLTQGNMTQTSLYGEVIGPGSAPVDNVQVTARNADGATLGNPAITNSAGQFNLDLTHPEDVESIPDSLLLTGTGVASATVDMGSHNCEDATDRCTLPVNGETREISGHVTGLAEGDSVTLSAGHDATGDFVADSDDGLDFVLTANALLAYGPLQITAPGYNVVSDLVTDIEVREDDAIIAGIILERQSSGSSSSSGFGCSLGNPERKDPVFVLLLMLAFAGMMRRGRVQQTRRTADHNTL